MTSKLFSELGLSPALLKAIDRLGYEKAAPIQSEAIPLIMGGSDVVGQSQTGSAKTAAFGIPAVESVDPHLRAVQVIILCPPMVCVKLPKSGVSGFSFFVEQRSCHFLG